MPHFYTDDEFRNLIDAIENKKIFKKEIDGQEIAYDFSKEILFDFSNVTPIGNPAPDLVMLVKAVNKNKNVVGLKLNNTPLEPTQEQEFTNLLLKNSILTEITPPQNLSAGNNFLIQNNVQDVAENYFEFVNRQRERRSNVGYVNPKIINDMVLIGKIEDLMTSNDPEHFKLLEHLLSSLPGGPIKQYYSHYSEFVKLQKERERILNGLDLEIAAENRNLAKINPAKQSVEKEISNIEDLKFKKSTIILHLSQRLDRKENDRLERELETINTQLQPLVAKEKSLRETLAVLNKAESDGRFKLNILKNKHKRSEIFYLEKLGLVNNNLNSFFSSPPYSQQMNNESFPTHAYLKGHFLNSGVVKKEKNIYRLEFEHNDKNRIKEGQDILQALADRAYGPAAHTIAQSQATSRTPTSEDDINGTMMQNYKKGMESGYQASQAKIALTYLSHLNQQISEYTAFEFSPLYGLDGKALILSLKDAIDSANIDAIEATKLITANIIGAMKLLHPDEILRKDNLIENEQMKNNINQAITALLPLFPDTIQDKLKKLLEDINSTNPPDLEVFKASVKSINDTIQKFLTEKYPNTQTIDATLTQMGIVIPSPVVEQPKNEEVSDAPRPETTEESAIPYFEGEDPAVVERRLEDRLRQSRLKSSNEPHPDSIAKHLESVKEDLRKQEELNLALNAGVASSKANTPTPSITIPKEDPSMVSHPGGAGPTAVASAVPVKKPELKKEKSFASQFLAFFQSKTAKKEAPTSPGTPTPEKPKSKGGAGAGPR